MPTSDEWWRYESPPTIYDLVGDNFITFIIRPLIYIAIKFYFKYFHKIKIVKPNFDLSKGGYIMVANHSSHLDTPLILSCFPLKYVNKIYAVAAVDYFFANPFLKTLAHILCNIIPIQRKSADFKSFFTCAGILKKKGNILIYPEGTRTRTGKMGPFKSGIGILIKKTKSPIIPIYIEGTFESMNYRRVIPKPCPLSIIFGSPIPYHQLTKNNEDIKTITNRIQWLVYSLSKSISNR